MTENHYTSDLVLGTGLGLFAGYVVPKALHYGWGASRQREPGPGPGMVVVPTFSGDGFGLAILGRL